MQPSKPIPIKLIVIVAAAVAVGIAVAVVVNFQNMANAGQDSNRFNVEVLPPEGTVTMARGETQVIPMQVRVISQEPVDASVWVFSTDSPTQYTPGSGSPEQKFQELRQKGFAEGFTGSLDPGDFSLPASPQDAAAKTVNLTLTVAGDIEPGDYYFVHSTFVKTGGPDYISHGTFKVTVT